jgi:ABC-type protease/lipase transport system fused ATPase/permease subunit
MAIPLSQGLDRVPSSGTTASPAPTGKIQIERVVYAAARGTALVKGISLTVEAGESVGIVGGNASGKTTLVRLLLGILQPQAGAVRLDGTDLRQLNPTALGEHLGYGPQDVQLSSGTIAENIARMGEVDSEAVVAAARLAQAHETIMRMPQGYDTPIGEQAAWICAGERQRIALARAVYGNPRLVALDEPDADLDDEGESALLSTLELLKQRGTTLIMLGCRSNFMTKFDKVAVLSEGELKLARVRGLVRYLHRTPAATVTAVRI